MRLCAVLLIGVFSSVCGESCRPDDPRDMAGMCESLCDKTGNCTIKAALLMPQSDAFYVNLPAVQPVFDLALADTAVNQYLRPGVKIELTTYDVLDCDAAYAVISAIDGYNNCSHVFFGPSCDFGLASVARITKFLGSTGTPLITTGGFSFDFVRPKQTCSDEFYMMVRAGPLGFKDLAYFLIDLFRHFNWKQLLLINEPEAQLQVAGKSSCHLMMKTFANYLKKEEIMYTSWDTTSDGGMNYTENLNYYLGFKFTNMDGRKPFCYTTPHLTTQPRAPQQAS